LADRFLAYTHRGKYVLTKHSTNQLVQGFRKIPSKTGVAACWRSESFESSIRVFRGSILSRFLKTLKRTEMFFHAFASVLLQYD